MSKSTGCSSRAHLSFKNFPSRLILIGLRGSGKTTAGRLLANKMGVGFFDTDAWVEKQAGKTISELFSSEGEQAFRTLERKALHAVATRPTPEVIATGGGIVCHESNRRKLLDLGFVVYLQAPWHLLSTRIENGSRPPLTQKPMKEEMQAMGKERHPFYLNAAHAIIDADPAIEVVVEKLAILWKSLSSLSDSPKADRLIRMNPDH